MDLHERALRDLDAAGQTWARTGIADRIALLREVRRATARVAGRWARIAARAKRLPAGSPLEGEEWITGPYALLQTCDALIGTFAAFEGKRFLERVKRRRLETGQIALEVLPMNLRERVMMSGIRAEVWMQAGVNEDDIRREAAAAYDQPEAVRDGVLALVLGAGNIAAIGPLDAFHKLFVENRVVLLKLNPVLESLAGVLEEALAPLIARDALRIVTGGGELGAALCAHPLVREIHITGSGATHEAIAWGTGEEAARNRAARRPVNGRRITSELGAVCPTIVVPGPWSDADFRFQAEHIATQKLHNSGFNCIACQVMILAEGWEGEVPLMAALRSVIARHGGRPAYYPGTDRRMAEFAAHAPGCEAIERGGEAPPCLLADLDRSDADWLTRTEVFAPAMAMKRVAAPDVEAFLLAAITWANTRLYGTLGANILIHPKTLEAIGPRRFEEIIAGLHYGTIAVNAWAGLGFQIATAPWGGFPGATLADPGSGIGTVHNALMLERTERTVITAPWAPFPRSLAHGTFSLLPKPPWFIGNRNQLRIARLLTRM